LSSSHGNIASLATASRIRELEAQVDSMHKLERNYQLLKDDHANLRRKYDQVEKRIMKSAVEKFDEYKNQAELRHQHAEKRIRALEQENLALAQDLKNLQPKARLQVSPGPTKQATIQLLKDKETLEAENEALKADGLFENQKTDAFSGWVGEKSPILRASDCNHR
jgi:hypothetical protein